MNAVDTNIWVYSFDQSEPLKQRESRILLRRLEQDGNCVTLWQVVSKLTNCLRRWESKGIMPLNAVSQTVGGVIERFPVISPEHTTALTALDLASRFSLSHWDSMLLAACIEAGVTTLYSEDLSHDMRYDSVLVVNPFAK